MPTGSSLYAKVSDCMDCWVDTRGECCYIRILVMDGRVAPLVHRGNPVKHADVESHMHADTSVLNTLTLCVLYVFIV